MRLVQLPLVAVCVLFGAAWSAPAGAASKSLDACSLLTSAQATPLLGGATQAESPGANSTTCFYTLAGERNVSEVIVAASSTRLYHSLFEEGQSIADHPVSSHKRALTAQPSTVSGRRGFYLRTAATPVGRLFVLKDGFVIRVYAKGVPAPAQTELHAMRDVLTQLDHAGAS